jgi:hypothetical protein
MREEEMPGKPIPSTVRAYGNVDRMEGKPFRDDLVALAELHGLEAKTGGWTAEQVALYLNASLHALYQISPLRQHDQARHRAD